MRCAFFYESKNYRKRHYRYGYDSDTTMIDGVWHSIASASEAMFDFAQDLKRNGWKAEGSLRKGYYRLTKGNRERIVYLSPEYGGKPLPAGWG
jgi:hypothetical protein